MKERQKNAPPRAPQVFHGKDIPADSYFLQFPSELFAAINTLLSENEAKIMLTLLGCPGDGSFSPSSEYMLRMTGIDSKEDYFRIRKHLIDKGYIERSDSGLYIDPDILLEEYRTLKADNHWKKTKTI